MNRFAMFPVVLALVIGSGGQCLAVETGSDKPTGSWTCWRGIHANGSVPAQGLKLVDDLAEAREVWVSDMQVPQSYPRGRNGTYWAGGYCIPIVAEGRVYVHYWTPPDRDTYEFREEDLLHRKSRKRMPYLPERWVDDVVHCFDAATGKTLWRTVMKGKGLLDTDGSRAQMQCCWYDGKVFAPGSGHTAYALDAATGKLLWENKLGEQKVHKTWRYGAATAADGVVVFTGPHGHPGGNRLTGLDVETGERLWTAKKGGTGSESPIVWRHEGTAYIYRDGALIEAKSGKLCWNLGKTRGGTAAAVAGDRLVVKGVAEKDGKQVGPVCFKITPTGFERAWGFRENLGSRHAITILDDMVLYTRQEGRGKNAKIAYKARDLQSGEEIAIRPHGGETPFGYHAITFEQRVLALQNNHLRYFDFAERTWNALEGRHLPRKVSTCVSPVYVDGYLFIRSQMQWNEKKERRLPQPGDGEFARIVCYDLRKQGR